MKNTAVLFPCLSSTISSPGNLGKLGQTWSEPAHAALSADPVVVARTRGSMFPTREIFESETDKNRSMLGSLLVTDVDFRSVVMEDRAVGWTSPLTLPM